MSTHKITPISQACGRPRMNARRRRRSGHGAQNIYSPKPRVRLRRDRPLYGSTPWRGPPRPEARTTKPGGRKDDACPDRHRRGPAAPADGPMRRRASLPDRGAGEPARLQFRLPRFRRAAAQQRAGDRERARRRRPVLTGLAAGDDRPALAAHHRIVAQPAAARRRAVDPRGRRRRSRSCPNSCCGSTASTSGIRPDWRSWRCCSVVPGHVWISPGQWGASVWFAALVAGLAFVVLNAARRADIALFFLAAHAVLLLARAAWLGDPPAIPLHQLQSGSLLIFAFFMISDPRTTPDSRLGRAHVRGRGGAARALARLLLADAAGALRRADRAVAAHSCCSTGSSPPDGSHGPPRPTKELPDDPHHRCPPEIDRRARRHRGSARRPAAGRRLLRLLRRQGRLQAVQPVLQGRAVPRRRPAPPSRWRATTRASRRNSPS